MEVIHMDKKVLGIYNSSAEVIKAIDEYRQKGYATDDFSIALNTTNFPSAPSVVKNETGVLTEDVGGRNMEEDEGFFDRLAAVFKGDFHTDVDHASYYEYFLTLGFDEESARRYERDINDGRILLLANKEDDTLLGTADPLTPVDNQEANVGLDTTVATNDTVDVNNTVADEQTLKLRKEQLDVEKDQVQTGEVEVHKDVVEEAQTVNVPVTHDEVYVERRKVTDEAATTTDAYAPMGEDDTIRIPIVEEQIEVTKKPVVNEEVVIGKKQVTETEQVTDNLKREEARIETTGDASVTDSDVDDANRGAITEQELYDPANKHDNDLQKDNLDDTLTAGNMNANIKNREI